jgi:hypothetical protein
LFLNFLPASPLSPASFLNLISLQTVLCKSLSWIRFAILIPSSVHIMSYLCAAISEALLVSYCMLSCPATNARRRSHGYSDSRRTNAWIIPFLFSCL